MKTLRFLILGLLVTTIVARAQQALITMPHNADPAIRLQAVEDKQAELAAQTNIFQPLFSQSNVPASPIAEAITPEIQALADGLQDDPVRIFNFVHDHIRHVLYFGSKKGAELTYLEKSGNEFDQCALLVAMLRAAGYTNSQFSDKGVGYQFGWMLMPYDNPDGSHRDLHHWLQLSLNNTNWNYTSNYLDLLVYSYRGYPDDAAKWGTNTFAFQRIWVTLTIGSTTYSLDPAFKVSEPISGINLTNAMGFSSNALMSAAGGTATSTSVSGLSESAIFGKLTTYTTNLLNYIQSNAPNASVAQILSGWQIVPSTNTALSQSLLFPTTNLNGTMPVLSWANEPTNLMSLMTVTFAGTNHFWFIPQLQGQRISLTFSNSGLAQLWQDDTLLAQHTTSGQGYTNVTIYIHHPVGYWDTTNNNYIDTTYSDDGDTTGYLSTNSTYNIVYGFEPDWGWLQERQDKLDAYRQQGFSDTSRQVVSETMNVMGLTYRLEYQNILQIEAAQAGVLHQSYHHIGRLGQESGRGYYFDLFMISLGDISSAGYDTAINNRLSNFLSQSSYYTSALEHSVIQQLQGTNSVAISTINILETASTNGQTIFLSNSNNWQSGANVRGQLINYFTSDLNTLDTLIGYGNYLLLPKNGSNNIGSWSGYGYMYYLAGGEPGTYIFGGFNGGQSPSPTATVNPAFVSQYGQKQPRYSVFTPRPTGADPVDMANGTFQVEHTDLSIGQIEPRGIDYGRYYNVSRRYNNPAGMAPGWVNNYCVNATTMCAPQASLGGTTPAQAASIIASTAASLGIHNSINPDPKNWMVTVLIAKWGADQLVNNGVSVTLGKDTFQFVKQPNGTFTPPANCTFTLTQANSAYNLLERHGRTFKFGSTGLLTNIVDQYNQPLTITYNSSNLVSTVKDWKNRTLTFTYSGTPQRLASIADNSSPSRSISYGYSAQGDLNSFTDAEGKTSTYTYDTNHQITATFNALSQLVVSNVYNGFGHITTQYTQGDPNKTWRIFWSGWQNIEQDPANSRRIFFYDDRSRFTGLQDELGNLTQTIYDGQSHIVTTVSPLGETNHFGYDANHNLLYSVDPLGFTNQFVYDNQNNLVRSVDPRSNPSTFGYNTQFSLTGLTNGAGDFVNYSYNSDGTLATRTDSSGSTQYGYDGNGQLNSITYPNSLGSESFVNSSLGDATSHTDANGNVTTFGYNNRRQLTNSVAPTNLTVKVSFDAVGNRSSATDARGNIASNTWSATRHLLAITLPSTPQGVPVVTNAYDSRDWLTRTVDPLQNSTLYTNDLAGRLIALTDRVQRTTTFGYDADGRRLTATNAAQEVTSQTWDARGSLLKLTDGAGHFSTRAYDPAGNQITLTNRNGKKWQFQFDGANRLTNTITPLSHSTSLAFNHQGLIASFKDPASQPTSFYYDAKGRLTNRTDNVATILYGYDANNNLTSVTEGGNTNSWAYDAYNRASSCKDVYRNLIQYRYDANGNVTNLIYPGGRTVTYLYDSLNRMTNVTDWAQRKTTITYDLASRVTSITRPNGSYRTISYDAAGQATNALEQMANSLPIAWFRFNWTNSGNMAWEFAAPLPHTNTPPTRTMTYDDDNRLATFNGTSVANDPDGNLTSGPLLTNGALISYTYDARNRLSNVGGVTNAYDALNNRVGQAYGTNTTILVVNPNAKLPQVLMRIKNGVTNYYVYGPGLLYQVTETATATNTLTYHYDYRGSTIALTDGSGNVTDRIEYSLYGLMTYRAGANDTPFLFNGRYGVQTDPNGLLYMRARYYNPYLCRFINSDPSGFAGGLNFYAYANGNPVSYFDPFGLGAVGENISMSWLNYQNPSFNIPGMYQQMANFYAAQNSDTLMNFLEAYQQVVAEQEAARLAKMTPLQRRIDQQIQMLAFAYGGEIFAPEMMLTEGTTVAAKGAMTMGTTTYDVSFGSTGNGVLDSLGLQSARVSNIGVTVDSSLTGADLANVTAHEGFHVAVAENFPNFAASSGRLPFIGAFPLYAEEVGAYGYGAISAGQYGQAVLAPISAFGSLSAGQTLSVLGTGAAGGSLWYYGSH